LVQQLAQAQKPLVILGGYGWDRKLCDDWAAIANQLRLPVACAFRFQDLMDHQHPNYVGDVGIAINPALAKRVKEADLLIVVGARLGEMTTSGYTLLDPAQPQAGQTLVHIHNSPDELGTVFQHARLIASSPRNFVAAFKAAIDSSQRETVGDEQRLTKVSERLARWANWLASARKDYEDWQLEPAFLRDGQHALNLWQVIQVCAAILPKDTVVTNGAGNFATWAHRFWRYGGYRTQLAPTSGAMGYGVPAGIAASLLQRDRTVLTVAGDGDFQMTGQELATAVQYGAAPIIIVFNNGIYGTIRMHQNKHFPGRVSGTNMVNPDFVALAKAYECYGALVAKTDEFEPALTAAIAFIQTHRRPALIELKMDPTMLTTRG
jgi:acetolactate synthase I/II/III large subunit